ncbi:helix-turn-helix domain-containing protein [Actinomycetes bacterium KLBMP 9797]
MTITDPQVMRALAHPARLAIMEYLSSTGASVTATEGAQVVGLSPSATSYHLRALAKYGMVAEAPGRGDGRERVWRSAVQSWGYEAGHEADPEALAAEETLTDAFFQREIERAKAWMRRAHDEPREWYDAVLLSNSMLLITVEELAELNAAVLKLLEPYRRITRQQDAPPGARVVAAYYKSVPID